MNAIIVDAEKFKGDPSQVNPIQLLNAIQHERTQWTSLMYVKVTLNGHASKAMVDTGATHNFLAEREVERLGLVLSKDHSHMKAVNSKANP